MIERLSKFLGVRGIDLNTFGTVFDIGSRDGLQALQLSKLFPRSHVVAIECNQQTLGKCRGNFAQNPRITLVEKAVNSYTGRCTFYPINPEKTITTWEDGNPGASSLFVATGDYPAETYVQNEVDVDCIRLDDLCAQLEIDVIDFIWMDLQGAELLALQSAGAMLNKARYIYTEVSHRPLYQGQCLFDDVDTFLKSRGFRLCTRIDRARWQQDVIYENTREFIDVMIPLGPGDNEIIDRSGRAIRDYVTNVRHVYLVGGENPHIAGTRFVDNSTFPFSLADVIRILKTSDERGQHYFEQLLKLYFPLVHQDSLQHILAADAGTIFLQPCGFLQEGRPVFNFGDGYHAAYFDHMAQLFPTLGRMFAYSGATHCMLFTRSWLQELHAKVVEHHEFVPFWEAYLTALNRLAGVGAASEYELYFNFSLMFHARDLVIRRFRWGTADAVDEVSATGQDYVYFNGNSREEPVDRPKLEKLIHRPT